MEYCRMKGVLLQAWSPLAQGVLMGNLEAQPDNVKETAALVREYAQRHETTAEAILLAWLLKHPAKNGTLFLPRPGEHPCLENGEEFVAFYPVSTGFIQFARPATLASCCN